MHCDMGLCVWRSTAHEYDPMHVCRANKCLKAYREDPDSANAACAAKAPSGMGGSDMCEGGAAAAEKACRRLTDVGCGCEWKKF